jgi:hypothetical protein
MFVGRAPVGKIDVRFAMRDEMIGLTLAEGIMLVKSEIAMVEVRLSRAEERTGERETEGAGGAVVIVFSGLTRVPDGAGGAVGPAVGAITVPLAEG